MEEYKVQSYGNDVYMHLLEQYKNKIESVLNNQDTPLFLREFYSESPNWYTNQDIYKIIDTFYWMSHTEKEKEDILNNDLQNYFDQ